MLCEIRCCGTYWHRFCCDRTGEGEWCTLRGGSGTSSKYCRTGCCGTYYDQHCCPEMTKVPFSSTTQRSNITLVPLYNITDHHSNITSYPSNSTYYGEWCNKTVGRIFCKTGCCGMYWNRTCCPSTTLATVSIVSDLNSIGTNQHRNSTYCCSSSGSPK